MDEVERYKDGSKLSCILAENKADLLKGKLHACRAEDGAGARREIQAHIIAVEPGCIGAYGFPCHASIAIVAVVVAAEEHPVILSVRHGNRIIGIAAIR